MAFAEIRLLANLLTEIAEIERKAEIKRQVLSEHRTYNPDNLYNFIAQNQQRGITPEDLGKFFMNHNLTASHDDLSCLVALYDHNRDGVIDRAEFKKTVLSTEQGFSEGVDNRSEPPFEVQISLLKLFDEELGGLKTLERLRAQIRSNGSKYIIEMFDALDRDRKGYVDVRDIYELLTKAEPTTTYSRATRVLRRLDRDKDNKVTLEEWEHSFEPLGYAAGNIFELLDGRNPSAQFPKPSFDTAQTRPERTPYSEVSYNITPGYPKSTLPNSGTLAYSKSPNRYKYSPNRVDPPLGSNYKSPTKRALRTDDYRLSSSKTRRARPDTADVVYQDIVTVVDRSPDRNEKRTYISKKYADGTVDKEERIYEPLRGDNLRQDLPEYRIERNILERPTNGSSSKHSGLSSSKKPGRDYSRSSNKVKRIPITDPVEEERPYRRLENSVRENPDLPPGFLEKPARSPYMTSSIKKPTSRGEETSQYRPRIEHSPIKNLRAYEYKPVSPITHHQVTTLERTRTPLKTSKYTEEVYYEKNVDFPSNPSLTQTPEKTRETRETWTRKRGGTTTETKRGQSTRLPAETPRCSMGRTDEKRSATSRPQGKYTAQKNQTATPARSIFSSTRTLSRDQRTRTCEKRSSPTTR